MAIQAREWRSMWKQSGRRNQRRKGAAGRLKWGVLAVLIAGGVWWWQARGGGERIPPVELSATVLPAWTEPEAQTTPASSVEEPDANETPAAAPRPETGPADGDPMLIGAADRELVALRGDPEALRRKVGVFVLDERFSIEAHERYLVDARDLAKRVVFSASPMKESVKITVKRGDTLGGICARARKDHGVAITPRFIEMINDVTSTRLRVGTTLKVPTERMSILVDKGEFRLYVLLGGVFLKDYDVGTGKDERTPEGKFSILSKTRNPQWTDPESGKVYRFGEPGHLIGSRWLAFGNDHGRTGFGIHGTVEPATIGRAESAGCIRMRTSDVEELFDLVPEGAEVVIRP